MSEVYLIDGARTPQGRYGGALAGVRPDDLAALVVAEAVRRAGIPEGAVDEVILGAANQAGEDNRDVARMAALLAGLPHTVPGYTVNRLCASGLTAVASAAQAIRAGEADLVVAGGVESMTRAPWVMAKPGTPWAKPGEMHDTSLGWRFTNPRFACADLAVPADAGPWTAKTTLSMGETAEEVAALDGITRAESDAYALRSHQRALAARDAGHFDREIVPVPTATGRFEHDEGRAAARPWIDSAPCARSFAPTASSPPAPPPRCPTAPPPWWWRARWPSCGTASSRAPASWRPPRPAYSPT